MCVFIRQSCARSLLVEGKGSTVTVLVGSKNREWLETMLEEPGVPAECALNLFCLLNGDRVTDVAWCVGGGVFALSLPLPRLFCSYEPSGLSIAFP